jgi:hypothetical protein
MNIKKIFVLLLFVVAIVGIIAPVNSSANDPDVDEGSFKVNGGKAEYSANYEYSKNKINKNALRFSIYAYNKKIDSFSIDYSLKKTKNQIKVYSETYEDHKFKSKSVKTYRTTKSLKNFYFNTFKKKGIDQVKKRFKK